MGVWIVISRARLWSGGRSHSQRTVVVVAELNQFLLDGVLQLLERLDGLSLGRVRLGPGVDSVYGGLIELGWW